MIIIKKKKILCIILIVFIIFVTTLLNITQKENSIETVALPVNQKTIVLDAGHGGEDGRSNNRRSVFQRQVLI